MDKKPRCKTCRWWAIRRSYLLDPEDGFGYCEHPKVAGEAFDWDSDGATDAECHEGIVTGPDFGCIHHEPKEPTNAHDH